jgi:Rieske Fe-S protein
MNTALALKANTADMNTALALKANTADVNTALALKANTADMNTALGLRELLANKSINVTTDAASDTKYPSVKSIKTYVDAQVAGATIADASESVKGKIQLAGDIAGSAALPTVPGLLTKENLSNKSESVTTDGASNTKYPTVKSVKDYVDAQIAAIPAPRPTALATDEFVAGAGQTSFTLTRIPSSKVSMFVNGIRIPNAAYSFSGSALTFDANNNGSHSLVAGDRVQFDYSYLDN